MFKCFPFIRVPNQHFITPGSKIEKISCSVLSFVCKDTCNVLQTMQIHLALNPVINKSFSTC